jgi:uncharacterized protein (DUF305 family)
MNALRHLSIALLLAALAVGAAQGAMSHRPGDPPSGAMGAPMGGMGAGMMGMPTATVDELSFLQHMIPHHLEAIESAEALLAVTERADLRTLLEAIVATQSAEVDLMRGWLAAWYPEAVGEVAYAPMMRPLDAGPVEDLERAWLEDMVMHHMMAVHEARQLLASDLAEHPEVAALAASILDGQMAEIHQMTGWLSDWFGATGPMGGMASMGGTPGPGMGMGAGHGMDVGAGHGMDVGAGHGMGMGAGHGMGMGAGHDTMGMGAGQGMHGAPGSGSVAGMDAMHDMMRRMHGPDGRGHPLAGMHGAALGLPATTVEALARAYLAGRGLEGAVLELDGPRVTYEVAYRSGDVEGVLRIDALTGEVVEATER